MTSARVQRAGAEQSIYLRRAERPSRGSWSGAYVISRIADAMPRLEAGALNGVNTPAQVLESVVTTSRPGRRSSH